MLRRLALFLCLALAPTLAPAVEPDEILKDGALEARARDLSTERRCLVCQTQSIDDSNAPLARDLRIIVRERLQAGDSDAQVRDYLVQRYGDFILLKPPFKPGTLLLWLSPAAVLLLGGVALVVIARRRRAPETVAALSDAEQKRLDALLAEAEARRDS
ncbi:MAG: cytochrome c-type biogenesis protein CcmH [Beijerinckiaceae bacterium]|nr:cytochrome c-type biogenesis protein CcmH [Beijerinckiaceae bacterium]